MKTVLFACVHNAGRSQIEVALFNQLADLRYTLRSSAPAPYQLVADQSDVPCRAAVLDGRHAAKLTQIIVRVHFATQRDSDEDSRRVLSHERIAVFWVV